MAINDSATTRKPSRFVWGAFNDVSQLPNTAGGPDGPNLQRGDIASVDGVLYRCTDPTYNAAVWEAIPVQQSVLQIGEASLEVNSTIAALATSTTPAKVINFTDIGVDFGSVMASLDTDEITVTDDGIYDVKFYASFTGSNNTVYTAHIRINDVESKILWKRKVGTGSDVGTVAGEKEVALSANDTVQVYITADGPSTFVLESAFFDVKEVETV